MGKMIQIRNVPEDVHRTLRVRAAQAGMTLTDYLLREIEQVSRRPTLEELLARIKSRGAPRGQVDSAALVRSERDAR